MQRRSTDVALGGRGLVLRSLLATVLMLLFTGVAASGTTTCHGAEPAIEASPDEVTVGASVIVEGTGWSACDGDAPTPLSGIRIGFVQDGRFTELATVSADDEATFLRHIRIPERADAGPATLQIVHPQARVIVDVDVVAGPSMPETGLDLRVGLLVVVAFLLGGGALSALGAITADSRRG